jgi:hypothetical protein
MVYAMASIEKPKIVDGNVTFVDGTKISEVSYQSSDSVDKHKIALIKLIPGTQTGMTFAIHLNDSSQKILSNVGDFPLSQYCKGDKSLECTIPIARDEFEKSVTLGIAAYVTPGQLIQITEGRADWDDHRAIFSTK